MCRYVFKYFYVKFNVLLHDFLQKRRYRDVTEITLLKIFKIKNINYGITEFPKTNA